nr:MAG TPA: hypothetical protein [Caudoviricetes sp.]DAQ45890.1 MAG TPA: hypothetical protein [Caudoviricetes sp.]DAR98534.1 MAG TPA: hypothetical protein [Caudoviricetes sp.]
MSIVFLLKNKKSFYFGYFMLLFNQKRGVYLWN